MGCEFPGQSLEMVKTLPYIVKKKKERERETNQNLYILGQQHSGHGIRKILQHISEDQGDSIVFLSFFFFFCILQR